MTYVPVVRLLRAISVCQQAATKAGFLRARRAWIGVNVRDLRIRQGYKALHETDLLLCGRSRILECRQRRVRIGYVYATS
jgi:hypothetical protein